MLAYRVKLAQHGMTHGIYIYHIKEHRHVWPHARSASRTRLRSTGCMGSSQRGTCAAAVRFWDVQRWHPAISWALSLSRDFLKRKKDSSLVSMHVFDAGSISFRGKHVCSISARFQASKTFERAGLLWLARVRFDDESQFFKESRTYSFTVMCCTCCHQIPRRHSHGKRNPSKLSSHAMTTFQRKVHASNCPACLAWSLYQTTHLLYVCQVTWSHDDRWEGSAPFFVLGWMRGNLVEVKLCR